MLCFLIQNYYVFQLLSCFLKMYILEVRTFFLSYCLFNQLNFSVVISIYKIHVFDEVFFFLAKLAAMTENVTFSSFCSNHCKGNKLQFISLSQNAVYQSNLSQNAAKSIFLDLTTNIIYLSGFDLLNVSSSFLNPVDF